MKYIWTNRFCMALYKSNILLNYDSLTGRYFIGSSYTAKSFSSTNGLAVLMSVNYFPKTRNSFDS